jgi:hypothetical protein
VLSDFAVLMLAGCGWVVATETFFRKVFLNFGSGTGGGEPPFRTAADLRCAEELALKDIQREEEQFNLKNLQ